MALAQVSGAIASLVSGSSADSDTTVTGLPATVPPALTRAKV